ncbi:hypothetical protein V8F33_001160 [Rhypophila sp. PSN 637]
MDMDSMYVDDDDFTVHGEVWKDYQARLQTGPVPPTAEQLAEQAKTKETAAYTRRRQEEEEHIAKQGGDYLTSMLTTGWDMEGQEPPSPVNHRSRTGIQRSTGRRPELVGDTGGRTSTKNQSGTGTREAGNNLRGSGAPDKSCNVDQIHSSQLLVLKSTAKRYLKALKEKVVPAQRKRKWEEMEETELELPLDMIWESESTEEDRGRFLDAIRLVPPPLRHPQWFELVRQCLDTWNGMGDDTWNSMNTWIAKTREAGGKGPDKTLQDVWKYEFLIRKRMDMFVEGGTLEPFRVSDYETIWEEGFVW